IVSQRKSTKHKSENKTDHNRAATDHETQTVNCSKKQPIKRTTKEQDEACETQRRDKQSRTQIDHRKLVNVAIPGVILCVNSAQLRKSTKANTQINTFPGAK
ncbi:Hypothetical predicted protein, partial [Paramuricea clavata]